MHIFPWSHPVRVEEHRKLPDDRPVWLVSDLHLGDGTRSDSFLGKDREFLAFLDAVRSAGARLVIVGDAIDFHQAWSMNRVLKAHARLIGELSRLAGSHGVTYLWGNHDHDISLFKDLLRFDVCESLEIGDKVLVKHGYQYDPFIGPQLEQSHVLTRAHHFAERVLGAWLRLPLQNFYNIPNRLMFWLSHKLVLALDARGRFLEALGVDGARERSLEFSRYWTQSQVGDPQNIFDSMRESALRGPHTWVVTGHSHLPGVVDLGHDRHYANTGSWTFSSAQYAVWDGQRVTVRDWITGREYADHSYRALQEGRWKHIGFLEWWRENYLGWLRFRVGEERIVAAREQAARVLAGHPPDDRLAG